MTTPVLAVDEINVRYGDVQVLWDISITVNDGEIVALLGANGAGKSTTLKAICGPVVAEKGSITYAGDDITAFTGNEAVDAGIAHIPERRELFPEMTVDENLTLGCYANRTGAETRREWVFDLFPQLRERIDRPVRTLSGGEQQMLAVGRGLMNDPDLLLLDEASLGLAPKLVETVYEAIETINDRGTAILLVEQNPEMALSVADRGYVLEAGEITMGGSAVELKRTDKVRESYLGG